jgi:FMN phosphatase YigB (HAD superfamily)
MRVGIDFDNTIVSYDEAFYQSALERTLVPATIARTKQAVRDRLRSLGREDDWTELQGYVYGEGMRIAKPFAGALEFVAACVRRGVDVAIISHKTRAPYRGARSDLHAAAQAWLEAQGVYDAGRVGLSRSRVFFELTKAEKLARIAAERCAVFVDDLPELLTEPEFPPGVRRLLFDPNRAHAAVAGIEIVGSWPAVSALLLDGSEAAT